MIFYMRPVNYYFPIFVKHDRRILVHLPDNYYNTIKRYPVLYMQDGELIYKKFKADFIVVCIKNTNMTKRWNYLSPWVQYHMRNWWWDIPDKMGGKGNAYLNYVLSTKTWIDKKYRTKPNITAIGGSSMGAFFSVYAALKRPDIFSKVLAFSPAVWFGSRRVDNKWLAQNNLIDFVNQGNPQGVKFWWYVGGDEKHHEGYPVAYGDYPTIYKQGVFKLYDILHGKLTYNPDGLHAIPEWLKYFPQAFDWLGW